MRTISLMYPDGTNIKRTDVLSYSSTSTHVRVKYGDGTIAWYMYHAIESIVLGPDTTASSLSPTPTAEPPSSPPAADPTDPSQ